MLSDHLNQACVITIYGDPDQYNDYTVKSTLTDVPCRKETGNRIIQKPNSEIYATSMKYFTGALPAEPEAWRDKIDGLLIASVVGLVNGDGVTIGYTILA
jgi:hypothetical protein